MKRTVLLLCGLLLSAFISGIASAESVRVRMTARVIQIDDAAGYLTGKMVVGQRVNALYVYNTNTPNLSQNPNNGQYRPYANEARMRVAIGSLVFESSQPTQGIEILTAASQWDTWFNMQSIDNKPFADGTSISFVRVDLHTPGSPTPTVALPTLAPQLTNTWNNEIVIGGHNAAGQYFSIRAMPEAAELVVPDAITVTPASGSTFVANQHFDAALILPRNTLVHYWEATANGQWLPLFCQFQQQVGTGRPSLLCPAADQAWSSLPAGTPIEFRVSLTDGVVYTETVNWERAP